MQRKAKINPIRVFHPNKLSNEKFFQRYARPGLIGIVGGSQWADRAVRVAQRSLSKENEKSFWSHVFIFEGERIDGQQWILESDIDVHKKMIRMGVQENHLSRYFDEKNYPNVGVLDFNLSREESKEVLIEGLKLLTDRTRYSLRELVGTFLTMRKSYLRSRENIYSREGAYFCSAFVSQCYRAAGVELVKNISIKNTTPEDIAQSILPHKAQLLCRDQRK